MKIYVLTAINSDGTDIYNISVYKNFEDAQAEMQRQYWQEWEEIKQDMEEGEEPEGSCCDWYAWLIYNYCEDEMYSWEINETEIKD